MCSHKKGASLRLAPLKLSNPLVFDYHAHGARGAGDDFNGAFKIDGVELIHLGFGDVFKIGAGNFANFLEVWLAASLLDLDFLANQIVNWLTETNPVKRAIIVDFDMDDDVLAHEIFGGFVEWIDEIHHIEAPLTEGGTNWRSSRSLAARDAQLQVADNLLSCHNIIIP